MSFQRFINPTRRANTSLGPLSNNARLAQRPMAVNPRPIQRPLNGSRNIQSMQRLQGPIVNGRTPSNNTKRLEDLQIEKDALLQKLKDNEQLERDIKERAEQARKLKEQEEINRVRREVEKLQQQLHEKERYEKWLRSKTEEERRQNEERDIAYLQQNKNKLKQQIIQYEKVAIQIKDKEEMDRLRQEKDEIERRWSEIKVAEDQKRKIEDAEALAKQHQDLKRKEIERAELERIERETRELRERLRNKSHTEQWLEKRIVQERAESQLAYKIRQSKSNKNRGKPIVSVNSESRTRKPRPLQRPPLTTIPTNAIQYASDTDSIDDLSHLLPNSSIFEVNDPTPPQTFQSTEDTVQEVTSKSSNPTTEYTNVLDRIAMDLETTHRKSTLGNLGAQQLNSSRQAMESIGTIQPNADDQPLSRIEAEEISTSRADIINISKPQNILPQNNSHEGDDSNLAELTKTMSELKDALAQSNVHPPTGQHMGPPLNATNGCSRCNLNH